jgi:hypothetical protein
MKSRDVSGGSDLLLDWRSAPLGVFVVGFLQTTLLCGPTCSVRSGVIAMITEASYSDNLRPALAYVNNLRERTSRWPERWTIHRPDGSFALYLVDWGVRSTAHFHPSLTRIQELTDRAMPAGQERTMTGRQLFDTR